MHSRTLSVTLCRTALGAAEAMATPTAIKTVAAIFPPSMRSTGFGLANAVASAGAIFAPILIPIIAIPFGWRGTFVAAGVVGAIWTAAWLLITRKIKFDDAVSQSPVADTDGHHTIFRNRQTWTIAGAKVLSDATWWLMLFWMPDFLHRQFGVSGVALGPPLALAYVGAAVGSLASGGIATWFLGRGYSVNRVRKLVLLGSAMLVLPLPLAPHAPNYWVAALILAFVLAAHQGFSTNLFALITDIVPKKKIGRVTSFGAFCGNVGGVAITKVAGAVLAAGLGYLPLFAFASVSYLLALGWIQLMVPRIVPQDEAA